MMRNGQLYTGGQNGNAREVSVGSGKVVFRDYSDTILRRMQGNIKDAAGAVAGIARDAVQWQMLWGYHDVHGMPDNPHTEIVDTGRLFDSITASVNRISNNYYQTVVGTDVPYAVYVHEGTYKLKGRPFITDGLAAAKGDIEKAIRAAIKKGF